MAGVVTDIHSHGDAGHDLLSIYQQIKDHALPISAFVEASHAIDWTAKDADELEAAVGMAIQLDLIRLARELSALGEERFPESAQIRKLAKIVAKNQGPIVTRPANPKIGESMRWLNQHGAQYKGMWIALDGDQLLGAEKTGEKLFKQFGNQSDLLITLIPE